MHTKRLARNTMILLVYLCVGLIIGILIELSIIALNGNPVAAPTIPRNAQTEGAGPSLRYVIMGDSTAIGQGASYDQSYAVATARYLAQQHTITWKNLGQSGARTKDVQYRQLPDALAFHADIALIAVGANDVTHFSSLETIHKGLQQTITALQAQNPSIHIILTGAPPMGTIPRYPWPAQQIVGKRTDTVNAMIRKLCDDAHLTFAPIAEKTAATFRAHPDYFAADKFHPNAQGYQQWVPVLITALNDS